VTLLISLGYPEEGGKFVRLAGVLPAYRWKKTWLVFRSCCQPGVFSTPLGLLLRLSVVELRVISMISLCIPRISQCWVFKIARLVAHQDQYVYKLTSFFKVP
jgi:hypothetical protein